MPFYVRKSLNFGGLRLNLSKSGVGISAGVKGFRVGSGPRGNYVHMGANGIYYRKTLSNNTQTNNKTKNKNETVLENASNFNMKDIDSGDILKIVDCDNEDLVNEINSKVKKISYFSNSSFVLIFLIIAIPVLQLYQLVPFLYLTAIFCIISIFIDKRRKTTVILYSFDKKKEDTFKKIYDAFDQLKAVKKIWHVSQKGKVDDSKYNAGANQVIKRGAIKIKDENPKFIKTNIPTPCIPVGSQKIYFFPDKIMIFEKNKVGALSYKNIKFDIGTINFVEEESVPKDSDMIGTTWKYVNKNGSRDKRFQDNKELPIMKYESVHIKSSSGLNELLNLSKVGSFSNVIKAVKLSTN